MSRPLALAALAPPPAPRTAVAAKLSTIFTGSPNFLRGTGAPAGGL